MRSTSSPHSRARPPAGSLETEGSTSLRRQHSRRASVPSRRRRAAARPRELREAGLAARKSLGQHFLTNTAILQRIADAADLSPSDTVIEIGAGLGSLTVELSTRAGRVIAIELDEALAGYLQRRFAGSNVEVQQGDALAIAPADVLARAGAAGSYTVVGNLPYNIAQPLLRHFLEARPAPTRLVVMLQAEVAESVVAQPGRLSLLGVSVQLYGEPRLLFYVPPSAFYPPPKVRSAVVSIDVAPGLRAAVDDIEAFFHIARVCFRMRRKQLRNTLAHGLRIEPATAAKLLTAAQIDPTLRPQALSLDAWAALTKAWLNRGRPEGAA
ncbi:MAG: ribosomal RNA small subunit methyltransferase A [Chloroflexi bacterium]|nr:ribosomal RNA small subunit methyltransferase A [Chloroflexota bacterium]